MIRCRFAVRWLPIASALLAGWIPARAAATGEFLFLHNQGEGQGGIWGVGITGTNFFGIQPGVGGGFSTTTPPYPNPAIEEFWQARGNGRIAFGSVMNPNDSERIYVVNGDNTGLRQVTFHNPAATQSWHGVPSISPDGSKVAYVNAENIAPPGSISSNANCSGEQNQALWVVNSDGTDPHPVWQYNYAFTSYCNAGAIWSAAAWSADGKKLALKDGFGDPRTGCASELVIMNADGSNATPINCNNQWGQPPLGLDWSPDGTKLAAIVACGGVGGETSCWVLNIYDTSTWSAISSFSVFAGVAMNNYVVRFSPDSTLLALYNNNDQTIHIGDLSGNSVASVSLAGQGAQPGQLWWNASSPGVLSTMTLGVPSVYLNACVGYTVWLGPSTFNTAGALVNHGFTGVNGNINYGGDGDSWHVDGFGNAYYNQTRGGATGTLQLSNFGVSSNTIPLTVDSSCNCQSSGVAGLAVGRSGLRYVAGAQDQFAQTLTVTNNSGGSVAGPINVVIRNLTSTVTLTNAGGTTGCTSPGSPYVTLVQPGTSLAAGQSASATVYFRDPSLNGFTYSTTVTSGAGAP